MTTGHRIAEVAHRSGFTASTLRYYEEIGLLPPPARTDSGYRTYDDATLERLAFIARAKQLGCTLEEIADLSIAWDGGRCGPVQDRLRTLVAAKLADAQVRAAELLTLTTELHDAATALERHRPDGACDDGCGCISSPETPADQPSRGHAAAGDHPPIVCTLEADARGARFDDWQAMLSFVARRRRIEGGMRLDLDRRVPFEDVARLAAAEHSCCSFFSFALTVDGRGLGLEVRAPDEALSIVDALFGSPS